jgi:hypothetical protein
MARPAVPTATQLLARASQYVLAANHGTAGVSTTQVVRTAAQLGNDRTVDARGWRAELHGGNTQPLKLADFTDGTSKPHKLALVGSLPTTAPADVGKIEGRLTGGDPWPEDESWGHLKNLDGWTGTDFDQHALKFSYLSTVTADATWVNTSIGGVISGMRFNRCMDGIGVGSGPTGPLIEDCWFSNVRDDTSENDFSNGVNYWYKCLLENVYVATSTRGSADRSTLTTTYDSCVIKLSQNRWRPDGVEAHCQYAAYGDLGGYLLGHGQLDKRNANSPKVNFINCTIYLESPPVGPSACDGGSGAWSLLGFKNATYCTASGTTLLWARCPGHPSYPVALGADTFIPSGMTVLTYQGNETVLTDAVQAFHNEHPQFGVADPPPSGPPVVPGLESEGQFRDFGRRR